MTAHMNIAGITILRFSTTALHWAFFEALSIQHHNDPWLQHLFAIEAAHSH